MAGQAGTPLISANTLKIQVNANNTISLEHSILHKHIAILNIEIIMKILK